MGSKAQQGCAVSVHVLGKLLHCYVGRNRFLALAVAICRRGVICYSPRGSTPRQDHSQLNEAKRHRQRPRRHVLDRGARNERQRSHSAHAGGGCFTYHRKGHYASNCPEKHIEQYSKSLDNKLKADIEEALRRMYTKLARSRGSRGQRHTNINFEDSDADYDSNDLYELLCYDSDEDDDEDDDEGFDDNDRPSKRRRTAKRYRCGRDGHMKSECYARTDLHGREIGPQSSTPLAARPAQAKAISSPNSHAVVCARCQRTNHTVRNCYASASADGHLLSEHFFAPASSTTRCRRCGRDGPTYNQCYASTHVSGRYL